MSVNLDNYLEKKLALDKTVNRSAALLEFERKLEEAKKKATLSERVDALLQAYRMAKEKKMRETEGPGTQASSPVQVRSITQPGPSVTPSFEEKREAVRSASGEANPYARVIKLAGVGKQRTDEASQKMRQLLSQAQRYMASRAASSLVKPEGPGTVPPPSTSSPPVQAVQVPQAAPPRATALRVRPVAQEVAAPSLAETLPRELLQTPLAPDPRSMYISGVFGEGRGGRPHAGVDVAAMPGTLMPSPASGIVEIGYDPGYGKYIRIVDPDNPNKIWILGHVGEALVQPGEFVTIGQAIATPGTEGNVVGSNPYHIHYEVRVGGAPVDPIGENPGFFAPLIPRVLPYLPDFSVQAYRTWLEQQGGV